IIQLPLYSSYLPLQCYAKLIYPAYSLSLVFYAQRRNMFIIHIFSSYSINAPLHLLDHYILPIILPSVPPFILHSTVIPNFRAHLSLSFIFDPLSRVLFL
ncbi:hypothetical protein PRIPAC_74450, partial [Pristionchus pacificus]